MFQKQNDIVLQFVYILFILYNIIYTCMYTNADKVHHPSV